MDSWTDAQLQKMKVGGNRQCQDFLAKHEVSWDDAIRNKYNSPAAELYRQVLQARVEGKPEPTELPEPVVFCESPATVQKKKMTGFGGGRSPAPRDALLRRNGGRGRVLGFNLGAMLSGGRGQAFQQPKRYGAHLARTNLSHDAI